jgi:DNA-binding response OmpR family regulator
LKRILLAEDEEVIRMLVVDTLEEENFQIDEATDGEQALQLIGKNDYDLLILDYMMPGYTGIEIIEKVRAGYGNSKVSILMLSAKSQKHEQEQILMIGATDFMAKPFSPIQLIEKVKAMINEN